MACGRIAEALIRTLRPRFSFVYVARSGLARGLRRRGGLGFLPGRPLTAEERWLAARVWQGQIVYDVGAWEGVFALFFARAVGTQGQVVAFEPNPRSAAQLRENVTLNCFQNVRLFEIALGEVEGQAYLHVPEGASARGHLTEGKAGTAVPVRRLDTLIAAEGLPVPDFIKIDVEGAELAVLRGAQRTLVRCRPTLLIEVHPQADHIALWTLLRELGYALQCVETRCTLGALSDLPDTRETWHWVAQPEENK